MPYTSRKRLLYDNIRMLSPSGEVMTTISRKRAVWYCERQLAEWSSPEELSIVLKFTPKGSGHAGKADEQLFCSARESKCVFCGINQLEEHAVLTIHHVVPRCYRRWMPAVYSTHNSHDCVALCHTCHTDVELSYHTHKLGLSVTYSAPFGGERPVPFPANRQARTCASALKRHRSGKISIPAARVVELEEAVTSVLGDTTPESIERALHLPLCGEPFYERSHGALLVTALLGDSSVGDLDSDHEHPVLAAFIREWRSFFLGLGPRAMPDGWGVDNPVLVVPSK
eukprot:gnl/Dysnectes_brevis/5225_a7421_470.p1 GENE.gnl/Dysnectes_brevis/5225_a7421_470~~gnl/Dysnectes_brevis/5225_a7421_470.p1  ORF type:complete len:284 (-),score=41.73 gnl/Dysnectes_brevis/5225_a7421_470:32-883(-)